MSSVQKRHGKTLKLGLSVIDAESGQLVFEHQGGRPLIPASVMKIVTSVAALKLLGSDYKFPTEIFDFPNFEGESILFVNEDPVYPKRIRLVGQHSLWNNRAESFIISTID